MADCADFDTLATRLFNCDTDKVTTPWDIQDKFNRSDIKTNPRPKKLPAKSNTHRHKEQPKQLASDSLAIDDSGLTREEKRISRQVFLMQQLEENRGPKKIKKEKNSPKINHMIQWNGLSIADYIRDNLARGGLGTLVGADRPSAGLPAEGLKNITSEYLCSKLFRAEESQPVSN